MDEFNAFVKRVVLHNKFATEAQMAEAEEAIASADDVSLLDALKELGALSEGKAKAIVDAWTKKTGKPAPTSGPADDEADAEDEGDEDEEAEAPAKPAAKGAGKGTAVSATGGVIGKDVSAFEHLEEYFGYARSLGASDLHIIVDNPPQVRLHGRLMNLNRKAMEADETERLLFQILSDEQKRIVREKKSLDFPYTDRHGRCRSCIVQHRLGFDGAFRLIKPVPPTFEELGLPEQLRRLTEFHQGLVLVTGPTGCGKSSTLAAMIELINENREDHIIIIEEPIEFVFKPKKCHISQRGVGPHTKSFANALRASLRENPDVIVLGELRDLDTISLAITASETGHLVFGTLPTTSAPRTIDRVLDVFPPEEQSQIRSMISESIKGIVCQQLVPRRDGKGRALALEILFNTPAVGNLIRERKLHQMESVMQTGKKLGMVMLDNSLEELLQEKVIDGTEAWYAATNKKKFDQYAPRIN